MRYGAGGAGRRFAAITNHGWTGISVISLAPAVDLSTAEHVLFSNYAHLRFIRGWVLLDRKVIAPVNSMHEGLMEQLNNCLELSCSC